MAADFGLHRSSELGAICSCPLSLGAFFTGCRTTQGSLARSSWPIALRSSNKPVSRVVVGQPMNEFELDHRSWTKTRDDGPLECSV
jgi:hypothetical protein